MADLVSRRMMKNLLTRRAGGARVVTENVAVLKAIETVPKIASVESDNYYKEPVTIEYYIPKESRFAYQVKYLYVPLYDPTPRNDNARLVMNHFKALGEPIDLMKVMDEFPQFLVKMLDYLSPQMGIIENLSRSIQDGLGGEQDAFRRALYTCEVLRKFEPSIVSLEIAGDYTTYNINWLVRKLNSLQIEFSLEDPTVEFLIQRYRQFANETGEVIPERFEILSQIYLDQAFPMHDEDFADLMGQD
ncbi:MAG TPA: hypothetical protein PKM44_09100 [Turneriella sp.]|nr:hypothetical protein [Turneriella sp.]HNL10655.1 hypothetical protein [Turneriella sp.]HNL53400.1 hypothetical protein [Turneriella sp.]